MPIASAKAPATRPAGAYSPVAAWVWTSRPMLSMAIGRRATIERAKRAVMASA